MLCLAVPALAVASQLMLTVLQTQMDFARCLADVMKSLLDLEFPKKVTMVEVEAWILRIAFLAAGNRGIRLSKLFCKK